MVRRVGLLALGLGLAACGDDLRPCDGDVPGTICPVAGTGELGYNGEGHRAVDTTLYAPTQARRAADGRIWVMDWNNHRLRVIDDAGRLDTVAGDGWHGFAELGVPAIESPLENPVDFDFLPGGEIAFVSSHDPRVIRLAADGTLRLLAGTGFQGDLGDGGPAIDASFTALTGVAVGPDGSVYVADGEANRVRVLRDGRVFAFAGTGAKGYAGDGGAASAAELFYPTGLAVAADGSVYIADRGNHAIRRVAPDGTIATVAGIGVEGFAGDGGAATAAQLAEPDGVALDDAGTLYIADRLNFRVRAVDLASGSIRTIAGTGVRGFAGDHGPAAAAELSQLARLSWSPGELFVADQGNSCARRIVLE